VYRLMVRRIFFGDNEAVYKNTLLPESALKKKHHSIAYHRCREAVAAETVRVAREGTKTNLTDLFTKLGTEETTPYGTVLLLDSIRVIGMRVLADGRLELSRT
jgi:hypothetical protein